MEFKIKAGRHYANNALRMRIMRGDILKFRFRIDISATYDYTKVLNGWSKVFGMAMPLVHLNSCRLVFMCDSIGLKIGMYTYLNGVSPQDQSDLKATLGYINPGQWYDCAIAHYQGLGNLWYYSIIVSYENTLSSALSCQMLAKRWRLPFRFLLHPYIGGQFTLDNDCKIEVELLKQ